MLEERLELRTEEERAIDLRVVKRLLPKAVSGEDELAALLVPEREGEHPVEPLHAACTVLLVEVDDHLGVGLCRETMTEPLELAP